jgi:hypothetical protein
MSWPVSPLPKSLYVPNESDKRKFGIDQSRYQGPMDFGKLAAYQWPKVDFVIARTGISWGYKDAWFREFWKQYKRLGIPRAAYHVLYPKENIAEQVRNCSEQFEGKVFDGEVIVPDIELVHDATRKQLSEATYEFTNRLRDWAKKPVLIYTRFSFITGFMDYTSSKYVDFFQRELWHMAQYLKADKTKGILPREDDRKILIPDVLFGMKWKVMVHQTGDKMAGKMLGTASEQQDTNRWLGTDAEFEWMWGKSVPQPGPEPEPIDISLELESIRITVDTIERKVNSL